MTISVCRWKLKTRFRFSPANPSTGIPSLNRCRSQTHIYRQPENRMPSVAQTEHCAISITFQSVKFDKLQTAPQNVSQCSIQWRDQTSCLDQGAVTTLTIQLLISNGASNVTNEPTNIWRRFALALSITSRAQLMSLEYRLVLIVGSCSTLWMPLMYYINSQTETGTRPR